MGSRGAATSGPVLCTQAFGYGEREYHRLLSLGLALPKSLQGAVLKRRIEFLAGRYCAARALETAGCPGVGTLPRNTDRSAAWPPGWVGSISHCEGFAVAVAGRAERFSGLGIDVEGVMEEALAGRLAGTVCDGGEFALAAGAGLSPGKAVSLLFSIKESLYKALGPSAGVSEFSAARVFELGPAEGRFGVELRDRHPELPHRFRGRFWWTGERVMTLIVRPSGPETSS